MQDDFSWDNCGALLVNSLKLKIPDSVWKITNGFLLIMKSDLICDK